MKKILSSIIFLLLITSCESIDTRIQVARDYVEKMDNKSPQSSYMRLVEFTKVNGEEFEGKEFVGVGTQKMYKLSYRAKYESLVKGTIYISEVDSTVSMKKIYSSDDIARGLDCHAGFVYMFSGYKKKNIDINDTFIDKGYVIMKKTDNGWIAARY